MLYIIETFDDANIVYAKENRTAQAIGKCAYTL